MGKENYKEKIINLINGIDRLDILEYLYFFIVGKVGCLSGANNERNTDF